MPDFSGRPFPEAGRGAFMIREVPGRRPQDPSRRVRGPGRPGDRRRHHRRGRQRLAVHRPARRPGQLRARSGGTRNVQDNSVLHVTPQFPCIVGAGVTIGHRCVVHACTIMDNVRIGIGAVVLTGAVVEEDAQVGAGAVVPPGQGGAGGLARHGRARQAGAQDERGRAGRHPPERDRVRRRSGSATTAGSGTSATSARRHHEAARRPPRHRLHAGHGRAVLHHEPRRHGRGRHQARAAGRRGADARAGRRPARTATARPS